MTQKQDLAERVVLITGASRGIGYAASIEAAKRGAHVIAVARTVGGLEELDDQIQGAGGSTTLVPLDITDYDGIDRMGAALYERWGRLDGLLGNAGALGVLSPVTHVEPKEFDEVMAVNVTANYRLLRSMDLLLRQSDAGRVAIVSSGAADSCKPFWGPYAASKAAVNAIVASFSEEVSTTPVRANIFYPGRVRTAMRAKAMPGEDPQTLPAPSEIAPKLVDMLAPALDRTGQIFDVGDGSWREI